MAEATAEAIINASSFSQITLEPSVVLRLITGRVTVLINVEEDIAEQAAGSMVPEAVKARS